MPAGTGYAFANTTPSYTFVLHNADGKIGTLDFNGPEMVFTGDAAESARVFMDCIAQAFRGRLEQERAAEREACAKILDEMADDMEREMEPSTAVAYVRSKATAIRARGERP